MKKNLWTSREDKILLQCIKRGMALKEIGIILGRTGTAVQSRLAKIRAKKTAAPRNRAHVISGPTRTPLSPEDIFAEAMDDSRFEDHPAAGVDRHSTPRWWPHRWIDQSIIGNSMDY